MDSGRVTCPRVSRLSVRSQEIPRMVAPFTIRVLCSAPVSPTNVSPATNCLDRAIEPVSTPENGPTESQSVKVSIVIISNDRKVLQSCSKKQVIDCGSPGLLPNGYIEVHGTTIGSMIKFICFDGMVYSGSYNTSTCSAEGVWVPRPFPQCLAGCAIPSVANGEVLGDEGLEGPSNYLPMERVPHGQWINITCIQDYELENSRTGIQCLNGTWSQLPICRPASCRKLPSRPKRGFVIATKLEHGMKAKFRCADGYRLEGSNVTWCHFGQWNITSPKCNESKIICKQTLCSLYITLPKPSHQSIVLSRATSRAAA